MLMMQACWGLEGAACAHDACPSGLPMMCASKDLGGPAGAHNACLSGLGT